ncbi:MAG TPA: hypothetical protein VFE13_15210 [Caulobacteraceae bacterium]|jgi:hypothetical protein|nr:hypothetical protein [Caulobacteraceae bacterium]
MTDRAEPLDLQPAPAGRASDRAAAWTHAEQRFYDGSPLNGWLTTAALFVALVGAYALAATIDGATWALARSGVDAQRGAWNAVGLSLIVCAVLGLQRYSRLMDARDAPEFGRIVRPGVAWAPTFSKPRLRGLAALGAAVGGGLMIWFFTHAGSGVHALASAAWFTVVAALLGALFLRGVEMTRTASRHAGAVVRTGLEIDLLRIEQLYPFGRAAGRTALVWFTVSAVVLLQFAGAGLGPYTALLGVVCAGIGASVFIATLGVVHQEIRLAKAAELETLRAQIIGLRDRLNDDAAAPAKLQSLLAYEARIDAAPEWPFDQTILVRVGASALILAVPWFGQAVAGLVVDHFGKGLS